MNLWYINGPSEGMFIITVLLAAPFFTGHDFWLQDYRAFLGLPLWFPYMSMATATIVPFAIIGLIPTLIVHVLTVRNDRRAKNKSFSDALALLVPFLSLIGLHALWYIVSPDILIRYPRLFLLSMGFVFCLLVGRMMVAALVKEPYYGVAGVTIDYRTRIAITFVALVAGVANAILARLTGSKPIVDEFYFVAAHFVVSFLVYAHFAVHIILEITHGLDFYCFDLTKKFIPDPVLQAANTILPAAKKHT